MEERFYFKIWSTLIQHLKINCIKWTELIVNGEKKNIICFLIGIQLLKNIENSYFFPRPFKKAGTSNCALRESWFGVDENSTGVRAFIIVVVFVCFFYDYAFARFTESAERDVF